MNKKLRINSPILRKGGPHEPKKARRRLRNEARDADALMEVRDARR